MMMKLHQLMMGGIKMLAHECAEQRTIQDYVDKITTPTFEESIMIGNKRDNHKLTKWFN